MPFMYAVGLYLRFIVLVAIGPVLWVLCSIVAAMLVHSSDEGSFNSLYGAGLGALIG